MKPQINENVQEADLAAAKGGQRNAYISAVLVLLIFSTLFLAFRSKQYTLADGALRCLEVYRRQTLFFHGNNHLLYPANILFWSRALDTIGLRADNAFEFLSISQAMNCTAAAGSLAIFYLLTWFATSSAAISWCVVLALGFSRAFLLHATNSAEPMVGLFFSFLALLIVTASLRRGRIATLFFGGLLFALAMATYQSMILIAPLAGWLCLGWPQRTASGRTTVMVAMLRGTVLVAGTAVGLFVIYSLAYWHQGARTPSQMVRMFFVIGGHQEVYGGFRISSLVNVPAGLVGNVLPALPEGYGGLRLFLKASTPMEKGLLVLSLILVFGICGWAVAGVLRNARSLSRDQVLLLSACAITLVIVAWPLLYGGPLYDKFWLQPITLIIFVLAVLYAIQRPRLRRGSLLPIAFTAFILIEATTNLVWVARDHTRETEGLKEASVVAGHISPNDAVVVDFDPISSLYFSIWGLPENMIVLPGATPIEASSWMARAVAKSRENLGSIYFVGILDHSEVAWDAFLGKRVGIPYHDFDRYRYNARIVESFALKKSRITLRQMPAE